MQEENQPVQRKRRKRLRILKKIVMFLLVFFVVMSCVLCCCVSFYRINTLTKSLEDLKAQLAFVTEHSLEQEKKLVELTEQLAQRQQSENEAAPEAEYNIAEEVKEPEKEYKHKVYLTFDDGPSMYTDDILDILDKYQVKATFFVVGKETKTAKESLKRIVEEGHTLGMHSYSHKYREIYASKEAFAEDFLKIKNYIYEATGMESNIYRFPGGSSNTVSSIDMSVLGNYLKDQEVVFYDWNIAPIEGESVFLDVDTIAKNCTKEILSWENATVLLHDSGDKQTTVEALPTIIENILALEDTVILPITEETVPIQHIKSNEGS